LTCRQGQFLQAQRVEHEFERQVGARHFVRLRHGIGRQRVVHVQLGLAVPHLAHDAVRKAQLAVRARANAQVVAKLPVVEVVPAAVAGARIGRYLVALPAPPAPSSR
jgi:hypothetical protein